MTIMPLAVGLVGAALALPAAASAAPAAAAPASEDASLRRLIPDTEVPPVDGAPVALTPEAEALLLEASMKLEEEMLDGLRAQAEAWARTRSPEEAARLLRERIEALSRDERYRSLFGERPARPAAGPDAWESTLRAYQARSLPGAAQPGIPSREQLVAALKHPGQDSAAVRSAGSAQEVYDGHREAFAEVCRKYAGVDEAGGAGFPRAILGILHAETGFGAGCGQARSGTCGSPSPSTRARNGAQRHAAFRIGSKGMFGPWSTTTAPASSEGAAGFCQFLPATAEMHLGRLRSDFGRDSADLFSFEGCIPMVAIYLKDYLESAAGSRRPGIENAVRAYNGGAGFKADNPETKGYHEKVTASMRAQTDVPATCREVLEQTAR